MAIKGTQAKQEITQEILTFFGDRAFLYNDGKEIRVNCTEDGQLVQIKIALTASKVAVNAGDDNAIPAAVAAPSATSQNTFTTPAVVLEPTVEEKQNILDLMRGLGL